MSKRSFQRNLSDEAEIFQSVLQNVCQQLAEHHLQMSPLALGEISFMLGFRESTSFTRAYTN